MKAKLLLVVAFALVSSMLLVGCGKSTEQAPAPQPTNAPAQPAPAK